MNPSITQSLLLSKHLRNRNPLDVKWLLTLDNYFLTAAYEKQDGDPFFKGPDNLPYAAFHLARSQDVEQISVKEALDSAIHWGTGAVIYPGAGVQEWIYSPGDVVSLKTWGTAAFQWTGEWGLEPNLDDYREGGLINVGRPGPEFLIPLAARCLESVVRRVYKAEPVLANRVPAIACIRPETRKRPEQASELMLNLYLSDFDDQDRAQGLQTLVRRYLPAHISRRLIAFSNQVIPEDKFAPLTDLIREGGLEPVPEY